MTSKELEEKKAFQSYLQYRKDGINKRIKM